MSMIDARIGSTFVACVAALAFCGAGFAAEKQNSPLLDAAMEGDSGAVRSLLKKKVDVNAATPDGTSVLHWVVRRDDLESAVLLIKAGADVRRANSLGVTPLALACTNGNGKLTKALLDAGADANATDRTGETMLMAAASSGSEAAVKELLDHGAKVDAREPAFQQTALMFAARKDRSAVIKTLIEHGADVNAQTRIDKAPEFRPPGAGGGSHGVGIVRGGWPKRGMRNPQPGGLTPLLYAVRDGHVDSAKLLLDAGADINKAEANGITPLLMAITNNQMAAAHLLIERKADINKDDWYGRTPLWAAVETRNMDGTTPQNAIDRAPVLKLIETLLAQGANPNARTKEVVPVRRFRTGLGSLSWVDFTGQTPFLLASLSGDVTVMRLLLKYKADPNIATFSDTTPLMAAAGVNWVFFQTYDEGPEKLLEAVKLCVELGADVNAKNSMGLQAVHGAANRGSDEIIKYLVSKGARLDVPDNEGRTAYNWAEGVFLATNTPDAKPSTMALIKQLGGTVGTPTKLVSNEEGQGAPAARGAAPAGRGPARQTE
jgi:ankyrin repeat protein